MKKLVMGLIILTMILGVTGCEENGLSTMSKAKEISDYKYDKTLVCEVFDKDILSSNLYTNDGTIVTKDNDVYALDFRKMYSNDTNCKKSDSKSNPVNDIIYDSQHCATNNCFHSIYNTDYDTRFSNLNWTIADIKKMLEEKGYSTMYVSNSFPYYGTKNDNKIYEIHSNAADYTDTLDKEDPPVDFRITEEIPVYQGPEDEKILDFYIGYGYYTGGLWDPNNIPNHDVYFIRTNKSYYRIGAINKEECKKYNDVKCKYGWVRDDDLSQVRDDIIDRTDDILLLRNGRLYRSNKTSN